MSLIEGALAAILLCVLALGALGLLIEQLRPLIAALIPL